MINNTEEELFCTQYELKTLSDLLIRGEAERWVKGFLQNKYEQEHLDCMGLADGVAWLCNGNHASWQE